MFSKLSILCFVHDVNECVIFFVCYSVVHSGIAWIEFLNSNDNLGDILTHLREGDMKGAQLLWLRCEVKKLLHALNQYVLYISNLSCNEGIFSHMHLVLVNDDDDDDDESKNLL